MSHGGKLHFKDGTAADVAPSQTPFSFNPKICCNSSLFLIILGIILRLVGVEYDLQKQEAAYRKMLVIAEDDETVRPKTLDELFDDVRKIHFKDKTRINHSFSW